MATTEEIRQRVEQADTVRSARRSAAAQQVGELARHRATLAEKLADIERQLGDALAAASDVIDIDELARFTDVSASELTHWLSSRKTTRTRRKRIPVGTSSKSLTASTPPGEKNTESKPVAPRPSETNPPGHGAALVT